MAQKNLSFPYPMSHKGGILLPYNLLVNMLANMLAKR